MRITPLILAATALCTAAAMPAAAYIGPGAGLSMLGAFWGLLVAILAALGFIIAWPLRRLFRRNKATPAVESQATIDETGQPSASQQSSAN